MSDGLKSGLIIGGAALVAFLIYQRSQASIPGAGGVPGAAGPGAGTALATAPGAAPTGATKPTSSGGSSVAGSVLKYAAIATVAPFYYPTKIALSGAKAVGSAVESGAKSVGSAVESAFKSIF